jgi:hypothetical protein
MCTYLAHSWVTGSGHLLDGGLGGYCRGLVPWVLQAASYGPKFWIRLVTSSIKRLGNHIPHIRYGPTT